MVRFISLRILQMAIALLILSMIIFGVVRLHGDPVLLFLPLDSTQEDYERVSANLGLDKPVHIQYLVFLNKAVRGDLGKSLFTGRPVIDSLMEALPNSLVLIVLSLSLSLMVAVFLGATAAAKKATRIDTSARVIAGMGQSIPSFWLGLMMIELFAVQLGLLPTSGMGGWKHYIMPVSVLAFFALPGPLRLLRSSMLEVLDSEYIRLARIKGASERRVIWKHALKNSILPVVGYAATQLSLMVTGIVVIETVFAWPGLGRLSYRAIANHDFPLVQGVVLMVAVVVILANLAADIIYAWVDPRIRLKA